MAKQTNEIVESEGLAQQQPGQLLNAKERRLCEQLASGAAPHSQRAQAFLALDRGATQKSAGQVAGLSQGQVRYWLGRFRQSRMAIFPENTPEQTQPKEAAPGAADMVDPSDESAAETRMEAGVQPAEKSPEKKAKKGEGKKGKKKSRAKKKRKKADDKKSSRKKKKKKD